MDFQMCPHCMAAGGCQLGVLEQVMTGPTRSEGRIRCPANFEGLPGIAFGGWTAAVFDDVMGRFASHLGEIVHTTSLTTDFLKPVPVGEELRFEVWSEKLDERRWRVEAELRVSVTGLVTARAHGVFKRPRDRGSSPGPS